MNRRGVRIGSVIRAIVAEALLSRVSDPRISRFTSITRVELSSDLGFADIFVSVMGDPGTQRTTMRGLDSACGLIRRMVAKQLSIRTCPVLRFHLDDSIKKSIETIQALDRESPAPAVSDSAEGAETDQRCGDDHEAVE